ncbi:MAG TPA: nucleotidyltransferase domain-containing protein, partial [Planctomycetota bacterium]
MRLRQPLNDILGRRSKVILLRYLVLSRRETTGRDLARSTGLDHKTCLQTLKDLDRSDVVRGRRIGNAWVYRLNDEFPIVREVLEPAFAWEHAILNRLARDLRKRLGRDAISIFLFGSVAKGTEQPESDIDLLIVARDRAAIRVLDRRMDAASAWIVQKYSRVPQFMFMEARLFA